VELKGIQTKINIIIMIIMKKNLSTIKKIFKKKSKLFALVIFLFIGLCLLMTILRQPKSKLVLVINTDKSIYSRGEPIKFQIASLDSHGHTVCNSNLKLEVTSPGWGWWNTKNTPVIRSISCGNDNITNESDYIANFTGQKTGDYQIRLVNRDNNQIIISKITVVDKNTPLEIKRSGAMRINPYKSDRYPMIITVKANVNYQGKIIEKVPASFIIKWQGSAKVEQNKDKNILTWDVDLKKGEIKEYKYEYMVPKTDTDIYSLGPINFVPQLSNTSNLFSANNQAIKLSSLIWQLAINHL
jgi:hypothetical protein